MADIALFLWIAVASTALVVWPLWGRGVFKRSRRARIALVAIAVLVCSALTAYGLFRLSKSRDTALAVPTVTRIPVAEKLVALTFDDGPTSEHTAEVLSILDREGVKATFFLTGKECAENPAAVTAIARAGHQIGNHTYDHVRLLALSGTEVQRQIEQTDAEIHAAGFDGPIPFRPPNGKKLLASGLYLRQQHRPYVMWDLEPDSVRADDSERIAREVVEGVRPGSIVLLHVMHGSRQPSRDALVPAIRGLKAEGYEFVTLEQLEEASR